MPVDSDDERILVLDQEVLLTLSDMRLLEQVVSQLLGRKVWLLSSIDEPTVPFA